jgi:hypothetical protein
MKQYKIDADKNLFDRWNMIGMEIQMLNSIVQNDMIINQNQVDNWENQISHLIQEMKHLEYETLIYISQRELFDDKDRISL